MKKPIFNLPLICFVLFFCCYFSYLIQSYLPFGTIKLRNDIDDLTYRIEKLEDFYDYPIKPTPTSNNTKRTCTGSYDVRLRNS